MEGGDGEIEAGVATQDIYCLGDERHDGPDAYSRRVHRNRARQAFWRLAGSALVCRDGSLNLKLDIHPGLTFNGHDPKHGFELRGA